MAVLIEKRTLAHGTKCVKSTLSVWWDCGTTRVGFPINWNTAGTI